MKGHWRFLAGGGGGGGGGVLEVKILEAKVEAKPQFRRDRGCKQKTFHGGVWIFSGTAHCLYSYIHEHKL